MSIEAILDISPRSSVLIGEHGGRNVKGALMDKDFARIMATAGLRASRELGELVRLLNEHEPDSKDLKLGIAAAIAEIGFAVMDPAYEADPALKVEFDARIERYGRAT